jgi:hypothetical protein
VGGKYRGWFGAFYEAGTIWLCQKMPTGTMAVCSITETAVQNGAHQLSFEIGARAKALQVCDDDELALDVIDRVKVLVVLAAVINTPRARTVERVVRTPQGAGPKVTPFALGFSYNRVTLNVPGDPHDHGVERVGPGTPKRGHMVRGFWRLIWTTRSGALDAEWVWVEGFQRGNPGLGWITKERHVALPSGETRHGFIVPSESGRPGERRKAERLQ